MQGVKHVFEFARTVSDKRDNASSARSQQLLPGVDHTDRRTFQQRLPIIATLFVLGYLVILATAARYQLVGDPELAAYSGQFKFYETIVVAMVREGLEKICFWFGVLAILAGIVFFSRIATVHKAGAHRPRIALSRQWDAEVLLALIILLIASSVVWIYSSSYILAISRGLEGSYFVRTHLTAVLLGVIAFLGIQRIDYQALVRSVPVLTILLVLLLFLVFLPSIGIHHNGASRWVRFGPLTLQPSEFARFALIAFLAHSIGRQAALPADGVRHMLRATAVLGIATLLILLEPNYGMFVELVVVLLAFLLVLGMRLRTFAGVLAVSALILVLLLVTSEYRVARFVAFLDPYSHSLRSGYQAIQSLVGISNGGLWGMGIGGGRQKLLHLPEVHTDFIWAVIGEEAGFVGISLLATIYLGIFFSCMAIACKAPDVFGRLFAFGVGVSVTLSAFLHMGICLTLIPTTGMVLPFISYGKSSVVAHLIATALVYKIAARTGRAE
jgi:cell division protein FtsW